MNLSRPCDDLLECPAYLNTMAGEYCADCGIRRIPEQYKDHIVTEDYKRMDGKHPAKSVSNASKKCRHKI
jgi:hypothetical protein